MARTVGLHSPTAAVVRNTPGWLGSVSVSVIVIMMIALANASPAVAERCGRLRTPAQRRLPEHGGGNVPTGFGLRPGAKAPDEPPTPHRLLASRRLCRGGPHPGAPAARPALEHVGVMQEPVEQRGDRGGVAEELSHSSTGRLEVSIVEARS